MFDKEDLEYIDKMYKLNQENPAYGIEQQELAIHNSQRALDRIKRDVEQLEHNVEVRRELIRRLHEIRI